MQVTDRLKYYFEKSGLSLTQVSIDIGMNLANLSSIMSGKRVLGDNVLNKFVLSYNLSKEWLLTGNGEMFNNPADTVTKYTGKLPTIKSIYEEGKLLANTSGAGVPYYDIDITATITESFSDVKEVPEFYVDFKPFNDCTAYLPIWGNSMFPEFTAGDVIAVKQITNLDVILWGETHMIITGPNANNMKTIKQLHWHDDPAKIILRASNPQFKGDTVINKSDILSLYIVKGKITRKQL